MAFQPNLGNATRVLYVLVGVGFIAMGLWAPWLRAPWNVVMDTLGVIVIVEGALGF